MGAIAVGVRAHQRSLTRTAEQDVALGGDYSQQIGIHIADCAMRLMPPSATFAEAVRGRGTDVLAFLQSQFIPELLRGKRTEDAALPELAKRAGGMIQTERRAQQREAGGSEQYHNGMMALGQDVRQLTVPRDQHRFPPPRPNSDDRVEYEKLLRVMGFVGVQQLATTGRADVLHLYLDNVRMMAETVPGFDASAVRLSEIRHQTTAVCGVAEGLQRFESNARFRDRRLGGIFSELTDLQHAFDALRERCGALETAK